MTARHGISAAGNWIIDRIKIIDSYPVEGNLANILSVEPPANGGAPYNVLLDLAKLKADIPLQAIGALGDDDNAEFIISDCQRHGVECSQLKRKAGLPTSFTDVM